MIPISVPPALLLYFLPLPPASPVPSIISGFRCFSLLLAWLVLLVLPLPFPIAKTRLPFIVT